MKHEIKNRFTGKVLFTCEVPDGMESGMITRHAVEEAISSGADLRNADLSGANLRNADLRNADLLGANLRNADLRNADLLGANLRNADLLGVDLRNANLRNANLRNANLRNADLLGVDLSGANLRCADLRNADLSGAKNVPLIINGLHWIVLISGFGMMQIGCQNHKVEEWASFNDDQISKMDSHALEFWNKNKAMLLSICDSYKHESE